MKTRPATIKQYQEKYFNWLFLTKAIIQRQAKIPLIKAANNPKHNARALTSAPAASPETISLASNNAFPKMMGRTIKKEKRAALERSIPRSTEVAIVEPLLEIPGKMATA